MLKAQSKACYKITGHTTETLAGYNPEIMNTASSYLGQWFGAGVQFASVDVKLGPFVPKSPSIQQVAVVFDPALDSRVFQHVTRGTLLEYFTCM